MAIKIRENPKIKGIKVLHSEHEISQFADDTSVILDESEESLNETLLELEWFKKITGLKINFSKTQVIWIGSKKYSSDRLCENWNLSWGKTTFTVLGINFDVDISKITKINYEKYLKKMKGLFKQWNKRNLTPIGKITVVKSLILPVLNHLFIALPNPSIEIIKDIEDMLYTFIWKSSVNRVKKDIMQKEYQEGGLKMINIHSFILALKSTWIRRLFFNNCKWQNITKLHWFQFRINHNILATNYFLKKIKIIDDANCNFCQKENETTEHIFWGCENVQNLLGQVNSWFGDKDINQTFLKKTLIFGDVDKVYKDDVYNAILLNIKYYIYIQTDV